MKETHKVHITRCTGEGQGVCTRCLTTKGWNRIWMTMLYKIDGLEGRYCSDCVHAIGKMRDKHEKI